MHLFDTEPKDLDDLRCELSMHPMVPEVYSIAVEALVLNAQYEWVLLHRGGKARDEVGKLEGIGGRFENDAGFRDALHREIVEEVGSLAQIDILHFLEVKHDVVYKCIDGIQIKKDWVILSYLCRYVGGELLVMEPDKCDGIVKIKNLDVDPSLLSSSCQQSLNTLRKRWDDVVRLIGGNFGEVV